MKRITAFLGCVCLFLFLLCPAVSAQAAELNSFLTFHEIVTEEHQNDLLVYGTVLPENGSLTVSIDSQQISDPVLTTVRQEKLPTTVYCLVDISTHMSKEQIEQQTDILDIISSRMGEGDSMVITTVGSKVVEGAVLDTMDARTAAIDTLKRDGVRADMYSAIVEAMGSLEKKTSYCTNRCLLILSDGILADGGTTQQRAIDVVSATSIPVYAIGITGSSTSAYSLTNADNMLKMAEVSRGGIGLVPAEEKISAAAAAQQVWETIQDGSVIKIDLAFVTSNSNNATVRAAYELGDTRWEDSVAVDLTTVPAAIPAAPTGVTDPTEVIEAPEAQTSVMDWVRENLILVICCAVALVAVIVVIVVVAVNNSRKKQEQWLRDRDLPTINNNPVVDNNPVMASIPSTGDFDIPTTTPVPDESWVATKPVTPSGGVTVQMTVASHQDVSTSFTLAPHTPQVLGRDDRADIILNAEDYQLSGKHCTVEWDGSYLYIQDMGSTNGTVLNGTNLKPDTWSRVKNGAVLHMGSFDYQVALTPMPLRRRSCSMRRWRAWKTAMWARLSARMNLPAITAMQKIIWRAAAQRSRSYPAVRRKKKRLRTSQPARAQSRARTAAPRAAKRPAAVPPAAEAPQRAAARPKAAARQAAKRNREELAIKPCSSFCWWSCCWGLPCVHGAWAQPDRL